MPTADLVLVDTHVLLWWQAASDRLSVDARRLLAVARVLISPISCWEVAMLVTKGRVGLDRPVAQWVRDLLTTHTVDVAELTPDAAVLAGELEAFHGDPADRFIYATAATVGVPLITKDGRLRQFAMSRGDVHVVW